MLGGNGRIWLPTVHHPSGRQISVEAIFARRLSARGDSWYALYEAIDQTREAEA